MFKLSKSKSKSFYQITCKALTLSIMLRFEKMSHIAFYNEVNYSKIKLAEFNADIDTDLTDF